MAPPTTPQVGRPTTRSSPLQKKSQPVEKPRSPDRMWFKRLQENTAEKTKTSGAGSNSKKGKAKVPPMSAEAAAAYGIQVPSNGQKYTNVNATITDNRGVVAAAKAAAKEAAKAGKGKKGGGKKRPSAAATKTGGAKQHTVIKRPRRS